MPSMDTAEDNLAPLPVDKLCAAAAAKRTRTSRSTSPSMAAASSAAAAGPGAGHVPNLDELLAGVKESLGREFKQALADRIDGAVDSMGKTFKETTQALLKGYDRTIQAQFTEQRELLHETNTKIDKNLDDTRLLRAQVEEMQKILAAPQPAFIAALGPAGRGPSGPGSVAGSVASAASERPADPCAIKIIASKHVLKGEIIRVFDEWMAETNCDSKFHRVLGDPLGKYYTIKFHGDHGADLRRCQTALSSLRGRDGSWRKFSVASPDGSEISLFVGTDKTRSEIRSEVAIKRLHAVVAAKLPGAPVHLLRRERQVTFRWQPMVQLTVENDDFLLKWNGPVCELAGIVRADIEAGFRASMGSRSRSTVEWSV